MVELTNSHFDDLCRAGPVSAEMAVSDAKRKAAVLRYWVVLPTGIGLAIAIFIGLHLIGWTTLGFIIGFMLGFAAWVMAGWRLMDVSEDLKRPVLAALAEGGGLTYRVDVRDPPGYDEAGQVLFGGADVRGFGDLFEGADEDGRRFAFYDASIGFKSDGNQTVIVFTGQIYVFPRRPAGRAQTAVTPDAKLFERGSFLVQLPRIPPGGDAEFDDRFDVHGTDPAEAHDLLGPEARRILVEARGDGRSFLYVGPEIVFAALAGASRYEPGSMLRGKPAKARVRSMFDDVCASLGMLRRLQRALDRAG